MKIPFVPLGLVAALLACGAGCAKPDWIEQTLVTVDVTGTWRSTEGSLVEFALEQQGLKVTGSMEWRRLTGAISGLIDGTVAGDTFSFRLRNSDMAGDLKVNGDEMTGEIRGRSNEGVPRAGNPVTVKRFSSAPSSR